MALFGGADDGDTQRRLEDLERRVLALERAVRAAGQPIPSTHTGDPSELWASDTVRRLAAEGQKIQAIKELREETGLGLKDAKDIVDRL